VEWIEIRVNFGYAIFTGILIGALGGLVFFVWGLINNSFNIQHANNSAINAGIVFAIIGFIIGLVTGNRK
jgi:hypothetical protein